LKRDRDSDKLGLFFFLDVFTLPTCDDMWTPSIKNDAHIVNGMISSRDQTLKKCVVRSLYLIERVHASDMKWWDEKEKNNLTNDKLFCIIIIIFLLILNRTYALELFFKWAKEMNKFTKKTSLDEEESWILFWTR
jgi:hypothetical protein